MGLLPEVGMPYVLDFVRHGVGVHNLASRACGAGDFSVLTPDYLSIPNSEAWLAPKGIWQAEVTGQLIKADPMVNGGRYDGYYMSRFLRTLQTARHLDLPCPSWGEHLFLTERSWGLQEAVPPKAIPLLKKAQESGQVIFPPVMLELFEQALTGRDFDTMGFTPLNGRSLLDVSVRVWAFFDTLARKFPGKKVIVVTHGELMWVARYFLERMTLSRWSQLEKSQEHFDIIHNCEIIRYARISPWNSRHVEQNFRWMKFMIPWHPEPHLRESGWLEIQRQRYTNADLDEQIERHLSVLRKMADLEPLRQLGADFSPLRF